MISNLSLSINAAPVTYPILDSQLPFAEYIARTRTLIKARRTDLGHLIDDHAQHVIEANSPFELYPDQPIRTGRQLKYGVLLIHGLLDCPFSLRDIGAHLQKNGILCRSILLPGHGTTPSDLLDVSYHDWIQAVRYGIESLREEVERTILIGYSTGAALSIYQALQEAPIAGIVLLSPAIKIKAPINIAVAWHQLTRWLGKNHNPWLYSENEIDYVKYQSITFNAIAQVTQLTHLIRERREQHPMTHPIYMVMSREDETVSSHQAIDYFSNLPHPDSRLLLYTSIDHRYPDKRILTRLTNDPALSIKHYSHIAIPFAPNNTHYGIQGDDEHASHPLANTLYGAYNGVEEKLCDRLYALHWMKCKRRALTYNPDFENMAKEILNFILNTLS